ncbi:MAG: stage II sporulation protein D [Clostridia bacterium]|nr:stage II sporulation protein D [Clostridia bacterium]
MLKQLLLLILFTGLLAFIIPYGTQRLREDRAEPASSLQSAPREAALSVEESPAEDLLIKVSFQGEDLVKTVSLEAFLPGVVAAEMPLSYETAALEAQAVAARSYIVSRWNSGLHQNGADLCTDSSHCLAWREADPQSDAAAFAAVEATRGQVLTYGETVAQTVFHALSGKRTESAAELWGEEIPYLCSLPSAGDSEQEGFETTEVFSLEEYWQAVSSLSPDQSAAPLVVLRRTSGGSVLSCTVGGAETTGVVLRSLLGLRSARFWLSYEGDTLCFTVQGYGHGVGMSQAGAQSMALGGFGYSDILLTYYPGCRLCRMVF